MEDFGGLILMAVVGAVALIGGYFAHHAEKKKLAELAGWARAGGYGWDPGKRKGVPFGGDPFDEGHSRWSRYHASREVADPTPGLGPAGLRLFEYHYAVTRSSGKHTRTDHYHFTCALVHAPLDLGEVLIRPEHWGDRVAGALGFDDIDMEDPEFSKRFHVTARDRRQAYDLIGASLMRYMVVRGGGWRVRTEGAAMVVHAAGRVTPARFAELAGFIEGFFAQVPRPLVNTARARKGLPPLIEAGSAAGSSLKDLGGGYAPSREGA